MSKWPAQADCDDFYGNPRSPNNPTRSSPAWESANLIRYVPPWRMVDEDSHKPISGITVHRKCRDSLARVFDKAWEMYGKSQTEIEKRNLHLFSGSFVFRPIRGIPNKLSMHSYGIALDIAAGLNGLGKPYDPKRGLPIEFVKLFEDEEWTWGGRWTGRPDAMHFQAAQVSRGAPPVSTEPVLHLGSGGPDVVFLQRKLGIDPDGGFGPKTLAAVEKFQKDNGLEADGVVGPATWAKLKEKIS